MFRPVNVMIMRTLKLSDGTIYLGANFMPDCRSGPFQRDDVLNLFFRRDTNVRISSDGYNVFFFKTPLHRPGSKRSCSSSSSDNVFIWHNALWMSFRALALPDRISGTVRSNLETFILAEARVHLLSPWYLAWCLSKLNQT